MRKPVIAGNWKMNKTNSEAVALVEALKQNIKKDLFAKVDVIVAPVCLALSDVKKSLIGSSIKLSSQNMFWQTSGAYTGEISAEMLKSIGVEYCIIGHSERRTIFKETNEMVNKKVRHALEVGVLPIMCVGETLSERESEQTFKVVEEHVREGLKDIQGADVKKVIIAYEPVWAIGTGKTATAAQAQEVHSFIRKLLEKMYDRNTAESMIIQYGGSVTAENISSLIKEPDVDGALVGGASLKVESFVAIVEQSAKK